MAQSRNNAQDESKAKRAHRQMTRMLNEGRSLSGGEQHCVFLNTGGDRRGGGRFACVSAVSGLDMPDDGRAVAVVDWDRDGDQDLWISNRNAPRLRLMRNDNPGEKNFLAIRLIGNGITVNRDAVGARVEVVTEGTRGDGRAAGGDSNGSTPDTRNLPLIRTVRAGEGFLGQSSRWLHFGIGKENAIEKVIVRWPDGSSQDYANAEINRHYEFWQGDHRQKELRQGQIREAAGQIHDVTPTGSLSVLAASPPKLSDIPPTYRIPLVTLLHMPQLNYVSFQGNKKPLLGSADGSLLINCWSTTCQPCLAELDEFKQRADEIHAAGIEVLALSVDGLADNSVAAILPESLLANMNFPFPAGRATNELAQVLNVLHNSLTASAHQLPVPTSFLVDADGRVAVIYKGRMRVDDLLRDARHSALSRDQRFKEAAHLPGNSIENDVVSAMMDKGETVARFSFITGLLGMGLDDAAQVQIQHLEALWEESPEAKQTLALLYFRQGDAFGENQRWTEAEKAYRKVIDFDPSDAQAHYNLGITNERQGRQGLAAGNYEQAIRLRPNLISARVNLARLLAKEKKWKQAAEHYQHVVQNRPNDAESNYNLGVVLAQQEDWKSAAKYFQTALDIQPDFPQATRYLKRAESQLSPHEN